ncbi:hypothetical protein [Aequorivita lipolytica]|uniref:Uncharacterized protein n=1 Tax=Aequorivita lipolytica TaxID=153267 RepID=A0A5C6YKS5_9FLAO|nr:hypothetical protein [Aequorivita lipolytica]TXD67801.1 hypothetical protein ESV24_15025 [Aequorivita lipolytica]SRX54073.1 hypothetical protein AEQU2_03049 [Aequorivita lipolytica]
MKPKDKKPLSSNHSLEWGESTWDSTEFSIRNRYEKASGGYNQAGSSELPWDDFKIMLKESILRNHFSNIELGEIMDDISAKLKTL